jgi:hypothetical protein
MSMAGNRLNLIVGAVAGAALVAGLAALLGALIRDLAHPAIVIAFGVFGAIFGAYAAGAVAYDRRRARLEPTAEYREGVLAELEYEPAEADALVGSR